MNQILANRLDKYSKHFPLTEEWQYVTKATKDAQLQAVEYSDIFFPQWVQINPSDVSLIAMKVSEGNLGKLENGYAGVAKPNLIVKNGDEVHAIWFLLKYVSHMYPNPKAFYSMIVEDLKWHLGGSTLLEAEGTTGPMCLNPFCYKNQVQELTEKEYRLGEIILERNPAGRYQAKKANERQRKAEAGPKSAEAKKAKSLGKILRAINDLPILGIPVNQTQVAKLSGLSTRTVIRNWRNPLVQEALKRPGTGGEPTHPRMES